MSAKEPNDSFRPKIGLILFFTLIFLLNFTGRIIMAPLMPAMEQDLGFNHGQAGALFMALSLGYFFAVAGSGYLAAKVGRRWTIVLSACLVGLGLEAVGLSESLSALRAALALLGLGAGLYLASAIAAITEMTSPRNWGKALAIHELAPNLSLLAAPLISEFFLSLGSWRTAPIVLGACSIGVGLVFSRRKTAGDGKGEAPSLALAGKLARGRSFWVMMFLFSLGVGSTIGVFAMLPLYLTVEAGFSRPWTNTLLALSRLSTLVMPFFSGWLTDKIGPARAITLILGVAGAATIGLGLTSDGGLVLAIFLQPAAAVCFFPAGFAALSFIGRPSERQAVISLAVPGAYLAGYGLLPLLIGRLGEAGSFAAGLVLAGLAIFSGALAAPFLKLVPKEN
ncbi:MAG: MFS transporter [Pseudomonadota bacterium]